jgi:hypothetical protein
MLVTKLEALTIPKVTVEANEGLAASNARRLVSEIGFSQVRFRAFPLTVRYLAAWGYVVEAWD